MSALPREPTRAAGLSRLEAFVPHAGGHYAAGRNCDTGPGHRDNVSCLSPWIRHRLLLEEEVIEAVLGEHSPSAAEKFIQEVCWRTYWKGWLELRPRVWHDYCTVRDALLASLETDDDMRRRWRDATDGSTGIECFDHWAGELVDTGYLHNHARMWFASIWIHTLGLRWELGADFFLRHLLDGDPASNTLSWRWVAGLQTAGKTYLATADNIARFTRGRFNPAGQLSPQANPPPAPVKVPAAPLPALQAMATDKRTGLLMHEEDLVPETLGLARENVHAIAACSSTALRSPGPVSNRVATFVERALDDGIGRAEAHFQAGVTLLPGGGLAEAILDWCRESDLQQVVLPCVPTGYVHDRLGPAIETLRSRGLHVAFVRRAWDAQLWPCATRGFFPFKKAIAPLVEQMHGQS